jgi:hypothetical protein
MTVASKYPEEPPVKQSVWLEMFTLDTRSLGLWRAWYGTVATLDLLMRLRIGSLLYSDEGFYDRQDAVELTMPHEDVVEMFEKFPNSPNPYFWSGTASSTQMVMAAHTLIAFLLALGWHSQLMCALMFYMNRCLGQRNLLPNDNGDTLVAMLLFWGMWAPLGARFSLDERRARRNHEASTSNKGEPYIPQARYLSLASFALTLQPLIMYVLSGYEKVGDESWENNTAVYIITNRDLDGSTLSHWLYDNNLFPYWATEFMTYTSLWLELLGPVMLLMPVQHKAWRMFGCFCFLALQIGMGSCMYLYVFPLLSSSSMFPLTPDVFWDFVAPSTKVPILPVPKQKSKQISSSEPESDADADVDADAKANADAEADAEADTGSASTSLCGYIAQGFRGMRTMFLLFIFIGQCVTMYSCMSPNMDTSLHNKINSSIFGETMRFLQFSDTWDMYTKHQPVSDYHVVIGRATVNGETKLFDPRIGTPIETMDDLIKGTKVFSMEKLNYFLSRFIDGDNTYYQWMNTTKIDTDEFAALDATKIFQNETDTRWKSGVPATQWDYGQEIFTRGVLRTWCKSTNPVKLDAVFVGVTERRTFLPFQNEECAEERASGNPSPKCDGSLRLILVRAIPCNAPSRDAIIAEEAFDLTEDGMHAEWAVRLGKDLFETEEVPEGEESDDDEFEYVYEDGDDDGGDGEYEEGDEDDEDEDEDEDDDDDDDYDDEGDFEDEEGEYGDDDNDDDEDDEGADEDDELQDTKSPQVEDTASGTTPVKKEL